MHDQQPVTPDSAPFDLSKPIEVRAEIEQRHLADLRSQLLPWLESHGCPERIDALMAKAKAEIQQIVEADFRSLYLSSDTKH